MSRLSEALDDLAPSGVHLIHTIGVDQQRAIKEFAAMSLDDQEGIIMLRDYLNILLKETQ